MSIWKAYASLGATLTGICKLKDASLPQYCALVLPLGERKATYHAHCQWWRFEHCAHVTIDPLFLKTPEAMRALKDILEHPCNFLPPENEITATQQELQEKAKKGQAYGWEVHDFFYHTRDLKCAKPQNSNLKILVGIEGEYSDQNYFELTAKIGDAK